jgi:uncharacterized phage protein (TIGR01671 family)
MEEKEEERRIILRAWDTLNKVMYTNPFNGQIGGMNDIFANAGNWIYLRYIGQKDKNDMKMFEGDIVNASNTSKTNIINGKVSVCASFEIGEILYNPEDTRYEVLVRKQRDARYDGKIPYVRPIRYLSWEIIGNIFENPWLLTDEEENEVVNK